MRPKKKTSSILPQLFRLQMDWDTIHCDHQYISITDLLIWFQSKFLVTFSESLFPQNQVQKWCSWRTIELHSDSRNGPERRPQSMNHEIDKKPNKDSPKDLRLWERVRMKMREWTKNIDFNEKIHIALHFTTSINPENVSFDIQFLIWFSSKTQYEKIDPI